MPALWAFGERFGPGGGQGARCRLVGWWDGLPGSQRAFGLLDGTGMVGNGREHWPSGFLLEECLVWVRCRKRSLSRASKALCSDQGVANLDPSDIWADIHFFLRLVQGAGDSHSRYSS